MPNEPPRKRPPDNFASFADVPGASGRRRKTTWPLHPMREEHEGEATDAARRLLGEDEVLQGLGRRKE